MKVISKLLLTLFVVNAFAPVYGMQAMRAAFARVKSTGAQMMQRVGSNFTQAKKVALVERAKQVTKKDVAKGLAAGFAALVGYNTLKNATTDYYFKFSPYTRCKFGFIQHRLINNQGVLSDWMLSRMMNSESSVLEKFVMQAPDKASMDRLRVLAQKKIDTINPRILYGLARGALGMPKPDEFAKTPVNTYFMQDARVAKKINDSYGDHRLWKGYDGKAQHKTDCGEVNFGCGRHPMTKIYDNIRHAAFPNLQN